MKDITFQRKNATTVLVVVVPTLDPIRIGKAFFKLEIKWKWRKAKNLLTSYSWVLTPNSTGYFFCIY